MHECLPQSYEEQAVTYAFVALRAYLILLKMLPNYYKHVCSHENTLITKFFGLHEITLKGGRKVRFVVMGNMFCTELRIHHRYDLKGSSQGRITSKDEINENTTLKDLDLSYEFHMDKSWRESLFKIGEKVFPNGDRYAGSFKGLLPHGKGKYTWSDGTVYDGEWDHGKVTGAGNFRWTSGATYEGEVSGGYLHGCGTFNGTDGSIYRGAWRINVQHGLGRKQYCNLDIYEGSWKEGVKEGSGRYDWSTEDTYIGNWKAGNMCGRGVMKWANSDMYDGFWLDGLKHGSGFYRFSDGGYYFGTWSRDLKDGQEHSILLGAKFHLYQTGIALLGTM
ncbi:hypothetical protein IFM89_028325 [Coptis chinensis]|uniref:1-phosphatidylinositol-4-phosphate 5-kinase n=1 Tax=Coptis chinensis TaxID=261450 RepID=A0A835I274_9MAGN|nr:hypothetical protein IFM89_028325 [Coptis chinensis]